MLINSCCKWGRKQLRLSANSSAVHALATLPFFLVCNAGGSSATSKRRPVLKAFLKHAVTARPELNPELFTEGRSIYMFTEEEAKDAKPTKDTKEFKRKYLSNTMEGEQLALECRCGQYHVRFGTLHSITQPYDLFCQWCECEGESWRGSDKTPVSAAEKDAMKALHSAGLDQTTACQVQLPFWEGRIDFYHIPSQTAIQADGSSHFESMHHRAPHHQLLKDLECCKRAWEWGWRLLRVHHKYARSKEAMVVATQLPYDSFVMLSGEYHGVAVWYQGEHINYIDLLRSMLPAAQYLELGVPGCVVMYKLTL